MPHLIVKIAECGSRSVKQTLAERLATTMTDMLGIDASAVSVVVEDFPMQDWMQQVYGPDIEMAGGRLLKRPEVWPARFAARGIIPSSRIPFDQ
jgi:4-oxalocrotonate tautomerase